MFGPSGCERERERAKALQADDEDSMEDSGPDVRRRATITDLPPRRRFGHAGATSSMSFYREQSDIKRLYNENAPPPFKPDASTTYRIVGVLKAFPHKAVAYDLLRSYSAVKDILIPMPVIKEVVVSIWDKFSESLVQSGTRPPTVITSILTSDEQVPWKSLSDRRFGEWPALCCGDKLRWEMLGLVYAFFRARIHAKAGLGRHL